MAGSMQPHAPNYYHRSGGENGPRHLIPPLACKEVDFLDDSSSEESCKMPSAPASKYHVGFNMNEANERRNHRCSVGGAEAHKSNHEHDEYRFNSEEVNGVENGHSDDNDDDDGNRKKRKPLIRRLWKYLKQTWSGVMTGTEPILEDLELPHRYRPENLNMLCEATGFSVVEMKRIYRGFKTECPTGLITEEAFHGIYSRFFPHGVAPFLWRDLNGKIRSSVKPPNIKMSKKEKKEVQNSQANLSSYSHYVFSTLDHEDSGIITFEDFVVGLSILVRGSMEEKLRWMFSLYDQDRDGFISREEMEDVVGSVFDLMGRTSDPLLEEEVINERVDLIFEKMDLNGDGVVSMDEFLQTCQGDESISRSIIAFANVVI